MVAGGVEHVTGEDGLRWRRVFDPPISDGSAVSRRVSQRISLRRCVASAEQTQTPSRWRAKACCDAQNAGHFNESIVAVTDDAGLTVLAMDEHPRPETTLESLGRLKPSFEMMGTMFGLDADPKGLPLPSDRPYPSRR